MANVTKRRMRSYGLTYLSSGTVIIGSYIGYKYTDEGKPNMDA